MTPEQMRVVIAEECGFKKELKYESSFSDPKKEISHKEWKSPTGYWSRVSPDYCNDLNAMHEAENNCHNEYEHSLQLHHVVMGVTQTHECNTICQIRMAKATALQRAEAFIKTVCPEKWEP